MKHGKRPTRTQKIELKKRKLNPDNWLVCYDDKNKMVIEYRQTGQRREIIK